MRAQRQRASITLSWLLRLRWGAVGGQALTVVLVSFVLGIELPVAGLFGVIGTTTLTNVALWRWMRFEEDDSPQLIAGLLVLDTLLLTALLMLTGGPANPFSTLYLVHVTLAAVVLGMRWGWYVMGLSAACFLSLFFVHQPLARAQEISLWDLHLAGTWFAFLVAATVTAYFVSRISGELKQRDVELSEAQALAARNEKLASLTSLAAGAAHELGTPLATIAVVAKELERGASELSLSDAVTEDLRLIREQVERCRLILVQMSAKAGEAVGEMPGPIEIRGLVGEVRTALGASRSDRLTLEGDLAGAVVAPRLALTHVLVSLIRNAFDASQPTARVTLSVERWGERIVFTVRDQGHGMAPEVLSRAGDPFFTTKAAGRGTGLGLFLARTFAERMGGRLQLVSERGIGTTARIELPQDGPTEAT